MNLNQYVRVQSENPAKVWQMYPEKGSLQLGTDGDITIVDMKKKGVIRTKDLLSKNKITPWDGWKVQGMPVYTIIRGHVVMENGKINGPPIGDLVTPVDHKPVSKPKRAASRKKK